MAVGKTVTCHDIFGTTLKPVRDLIPSQSLYLRICHMRDCAVGVVVKLCVGGESLSGRVGVLVPIRRWHGDC